MNYYRNYQLDSLTEFDLSQADMNLLDACIWMVDNRATIRCTASNCGFTRSTLHRLIHTRLKNLSFELYQCVMRVINNNLHH